MNKFIMMMAVLGLAACAKAPSAAHPELDSAHEKMEADHRAM